MKHKHSAQTGDKRLNWELTATLGLQKESSWTPKGRYFIINKLLLFCLNLISNTQQIFFSTPKMAHTIWLSPKPYVSPVSAERHAPKERYLC